MFLRPFCDLFDRHLQWGCAACLHLHLVRYEGERSESGCISRLLHYSVKQRAERIKTETHEDHPGHS
ncbi:hypothetical protein SDC9_26892 [bioreactor metagenome]|uniref:Uncharacterized protein n=1 Tax=bioreactor metagenome TaxID=1076179 RepID=A0A644UPZ6_9ZZZZ